MDQEKALKAVHTRIAACTQCALHIGRTKTVPGDGPLGALVMFIGEAPGFHEDQQGIPFVGAAGRLLNELLQQVGIPRQQVFITNVIKCRPPGNRDPNPDEVEACKGHLDEQIEIVAPQVIVTLGRHSMVRAFPEEKISVVHGQARRVGERVYFPMYHPAAALHQPSLRGIIEADFQQLGALLDGTLQPEEFAPPPEAEQLSLF
jgi:uracil-DNA glycosylase